MSLQAQLQDALSNPAFPGGVGKEGGVPLSPHNHQVSAETV